MCNIFLFILNKKEIHDCSFFYLNLFMPDSWELI